MSENTMTIAESYMAAWQRKDIEEIARHLHPQVHFKGPMAEVTGREAVVGSAQRMFPLMKEIVIQSKFASANQAIFTYDFLCAEPVGSCRTAELMTFEDGQIKSIELFFDARPFEKLARSATK
jgi:ketosteroid isomerase-like protein